MRTGLLSALIAFALLFPGFARASGAQCEAAFGARDGQTTPVLTVKFHEKRSWALQLYLKSFDELERFFKEQEGRPGADLIDSMLQQDLRRIFFNLESLSAIYVRADHKYFGAARVRFKSLEDALGRLDLQLSLKKKAEAVGVPELVRYFEGRVVKSRAELLTSFENAGLVAAPLGTLWDWRREFVSYDGWLNGKDDRKFLVGQMIDYAEQLADDVKQNKFDSPDIERGLHEFRRRLRWIAIQIATIDGLTTHAKSPKLGSEARAWFDELLAKEPDLLNGKYIRQSPSLIDHPVRIPVEPHAIISELIAAIGKKKDAAEGQIYIKQAMDELKLPSSVQELVMGQLVGAPGAVPVDHQALSRELQERIARSKVLHDFAKSLKELNE